MSLYNDFQRRQSSTAVLTIIWIVQDK